jgi:hypothetical protein
MWFDNWERDLIELGTATLDPLTNKPTIQKGQLTNICNFDKTCLSLDDSNLNRGGQPEMVLYDPQFPLVGKAASKSTLTMTMITGSTAAGEALSPHLQFQTKAKTNNMMRLQYDVEEHMPSIWGKFGKDKVCLWPVTFGQNEKGGMDDEEFEKYLLNLIMLLYPIAKDRPGKRVILKVDSGPGRTNLSLFTKLRLLGFVLYPCMPNTMHVMQKTNQNYGSFKTHFSQTLEDIVDARLKAKQKSVTSTKGCGIAPVWRS